MSYFHYYVLCLIIKNTFQADNIDEQNERYGYFNHQEIKRQNKLHLNVYQNLKQSYNPFRNNSLIYKYIPNFYINQIPSSVPHIYQISNPIPINDKMHVNTNINAIQNSVPNIDSNIKSIYSNNLNFKCIPNINQPTNYNLNNNLNTNHFLNTNPIPLFINKDKNRLNLCYNQTTNLNFLQNQNFNLTNKISQNIDENWSREDFIEKTMHYVLPICCKVRGKVELRNILNNIWKYVSNKKAELSIFLSIVLSNTMYFTNLKEISDEKYTKRGLLLISGINNYKILQEINFNIINFVGNPWILECLDKYTIACTAKYWHCFINNPHKKITNFVDMLSLNNLNMYGENYISPFSKEIQQKYFIYGILWTLYNN